MVKDGCQVIVWRVARSITPLIAHYTYGCNLDTKDAYKELESLLLPKSLARQVEPSPSTRDEGQVHWQHGVADTVTVALTQVVEYCHGRGEEMESWVELVR